jgi:phosphatidylglycerophosphate synthase
VTDRSPPPALPPGHAGKAADIEELTDRYFTRPAGSVVASAAAMLRMTPTQVTIVGGIVGIAGGALLYDERLGWMAFALLFVHAILDSADGQLARRTGQTSELGRVLDGVGGYVTHIAMYIAVAAGHIERGGSTSILFWMLAAGLSTIAHAQYQAYSAMQRLLVGSHEDVLAALNARSPGGMISENEQQRYRESFRPLVRGWNLMGDNMRRYGVGLVVFLHRIDLLFAFIVILLNVVFIGMRIRQTRADRRFLAGA